MFRAEDIKTLLVYNNFIYFDVHKFVCNQICLITEGLRFVKVSPLGADKFFNITLPPFDLKRAYFYDKTGGDLSTLIIETVPESGIKICEALKIKPNQAAENSKERTVRVAVQLRGKSGEIQKILEEYFAIFSSVSWKLERTLSESVQKYLDLIFNSQRSSTQQTNAVNPIATPSVIEIDDDDNIGNQHYLNSDDLLFSYPLNKTVSIPIRKSDVSCLEEGQYLSDKILFFYLKFMEKNLIARRIADRIHIFDTLFYYHLTHRARESKAQTQNNEPLSDRCYNRVKKWTKGTNIFEKDFIIIPINKNGHWFAAIICYPSRGEFIEVIGKYPKRSFICFMDSLQIAHNGYELFTPIRQFLTKEWESKKTTKKSFNKSVMPEIYLKVPEQNNDFDCGLYILQCVENFLNNPDYIIERICKDPAINLGDWFSFSSVSSKRRTIKRLIERKSKN